MSLRGSLCRLTLRTLGSDLVGPFGVLPTDSVLSLALQVREAHGAADSKVPQIIWEGAVLHYDSTIADAGLPDGAELQLIWSPAGPCLEEPGRSHTDVVPARPALDGVGLSRVLESARISGELDLAGCRAVGTALAEQLPTSLLALDVRQCRMSAAQTEAVFQALPAGLVTLRASRNAIAPAALRRIKEAGCRLRVLDVGFSDLEDDIGEIGFEDIRPLLGEHTEELGLGGIATHDMVTGVAACCPNVRKLDINFLTDAGEEAWKALASGCPRLEVVEAKRCACTPPALAALASGCPGLRALTLGKVSGADPAATPPVLESLRALDCLRVEVASVEEVAAAARLPVRWLKLSTPSAGLRGALAEVAADNLELELGEVSEVPLDALGARLRGVMSDGTRRTALLPALAAAAPRCPNLLRLSVWYGEHIEPGDLETIAASCPLLEEVVLYADALGMLGFILEPIDSGVRALGRHCPRLLHLDLQNRPMQDAAQTLAEACTGWPKLQYLCAAGTTGGPFNDAWSDERQLCLPRALAEHCPRLQELNIVRGSRSLSTPATWWPLLEGGCPLLKRDCSDGESAVMPGLARSMLFTMDAMESDSESDASGGLRTRD